MNELAHDLPLLPTLAAVTRIARSLYGPGKARKQVTDAHDVTQFTSDAFEIIHTLSSEHAVLAMLRASLHDHMHEYGTRCTTLLNVTNVLAEAAVDLQRHGVPVDAIRDALARAERSCLQTLKRMRMPLAEAISGFADASHATKLQLLGERLETRSFSDSTDPSGPTLPMQLALAVLADVDPRALLDDAFRIDSIVMTRVALGGASSVDAAGSCVFSGILAPVDATHSARLRHWFLHSQSFSTSSDSRDEHVAVAASLIVRGVVAVVGDLDVTDLDAWQHNAATSVQTVFVLGNVAAQAMDRSWRVQPDATQHALQCIIPVDSHNELQRIADLSGAQLIDTWSELLPSAIGTAPLELRLIDVATTRLGNDDDDDDNDDSNAIGTRVYTTIFVHIDRNEQCNALPMLKTLLVRGATRSAAHELEQRVRKALHRIVLALQSGYVLPSSGAYLCACAAELELERKQLESADASTSAVAFAMDRVVSALTELAVALVRNTGQATLDDSGIVMTDNSVFAHMAAVRRVVRNYTKGVEAVGHTQFYVSCYFGSADFCVLTGDTAASPSKQRLDDFWSVRAAFERSFALLELVLSVASYRISARRCSGDWGQYWSACTCSRCAPFSGAADRKHQQQQPWSSGAVEYAALELYATGCTPRVFLDLRF